MCHSDMMLIMGKATHVCGYMGYAMVGMCPPNLMCWKLNPNAAMFGGGA